MQQSSVPCDVVTSTEEAALYPCRSVVESAPDSCLSVEEAEEAVLKEP